MAAGRGGGVRGVRAVAGGGVRGEGKCKFDGADLAEWARWVSLSVQGIACTSCAAAADAVWR